jgi:hypothetical protein
MQFQTARLRRRLNRRASLISMVVELASPAS